MKKELKANKEQRVRLTVFKSNVYIYAQIIDDKKGITLVSSSSLKEKNGKGRIEKAMLVGENIAKKALAKRVKKVWFDRGRYRYHGRIKALAEGARKGGLDF